MKIRRSNVLPLALTLISFSFLYFLSRAVTEEQLRNIISDAGVFGPLVFISLIILTYILAPLSGSPLLFAGFFAFGQTVIFYSFIASFITSITNFWIAKKWGRGVVEKFAGEKNMQKIDRLTANYGLEALFIIRMFLVGLHDLISYAAGLTSLKFSSYLLISTLGTIPGTLILYFLSRYAQNPVNFTILHLGLVYIGAIIFALLSLIKKNSKNRS